MSDDTLRQFIAFLPVPFLPSPFGCHHAKRRSYNSKQKSSRGKQRNSPKVNKLYPFQLLSPSLSYVCHTEHFSFLSLSSSPALFAALSLAYPSYPSCLFLPPSPSPGAEGGGSAIPFGGLLFPALILKVSCLVLRHPVLLSSLFPSFSVTAPKDPPVFSCHPSSSPSKPRVLDRRSA